jgi:hypothetical protein
MTKKYTCVCISNLKPVHLKSFHWKSRKSFKVSFLSLGVYQGPLSPSPFNVGRSLKVQVWKTFEAARLKRSSCVIWIAKKSILKNGNNRLALFSVSIKFLFWNRKIRWSLLTRLKIDDDTALWTSLYWMIV